MAKKVMRLVDPWTGLMECKVCGAEHVARIKPMSGGRYYRGAWQCQHGCELPEKTAADGGPSSGIGGAAA